MAYLNALQHLVSAPFYSLTADSRKVDVGSLFLAYKGQKSDGRDFIAQAIQNGAAGVLFDDAGFVWDESWHVPHVAVAGLRHQAGEVADEFYGHPSQKLWTVGVTGTNGKTSVSQWIAQTFDTLKRKTAVIGTLGNGFIGSLNATDNTTPDAILLHGMLADYLEQEAEAVAMEVSSHGLDQGRVSGVHFDIAVFTNLSRDHLDYHGDMASYGAAKKKLFAWDSLSCAVVNIDDDFGRDLAAELKANDKNVLTYGIGFGDVNAKSLQLEQGRITLQVATPQGDASLSAKVIGRFNAYNLLAVLATLLASKVSLNDAVKAISQIHAVPGRMQVLGGDTLPLVVVDYAHTPDALEKALLTLKEQTQGKLVCIFGCGGNRDAGKRNVMGKIATEIADAVIVTSDNPRDENAEDIIRQIVQGITKHHIIETDRASAIAIGVLSAKAGDVVLIAGKGHEDYQEVSGVKQHFSDIEQAEMVLKLYEESFS
ncbi:MAG: UDP-N-acetylmuramoyl-L-alanyl-D-glutamate--2,6-diaminopimelate ligase [Methylophilaceae bacterium]|nr:UDP-N-acetylmuramoyl-L-alanyl-D-glutamate--2,6-diaminopimelate ligase [Methylophilaceae bacterium]